MIYLSDVPNPVDITEAIELAKIYSTGDSSSFINGVLGKVESSLSRDNMTGDSLSL